jgi:signal peptidase I
MTDEKRQGGGRRRRSRRKSEHGASATPPTPETAQARDDASSATAKTPQRGVFMHIREWIDPLVFAYLLAMFIRTFVVELFKIPSGSMTPTLIGDVVANVDYDGDGDEDLILERGHGLGMTSYQVFLRDGEGYESGRTPLVSGLPLTEAALFQERKRKRFDRICVSKFAYWFKGPERGDIVVFKVPQNIWQRDKPIYVKRLVGRPNELVAIRENRLWIDGSPVVEPPFFSDKFYTNECDRKYFSERALDDGEYLVFGDNTLSSKDSRDWGPVPRENFKGKAFFRYLPLKHWSFLN